MKRWLIALALIAFASTAEARSKFDRLLSRGMQQYRAEDYEAAAATFEKAYAIKRAPELVYNVARCHERTLKTGEALAAYERFLALSGTPAKLRERARKAIAALRAELPVVAQTKTASVALPVIVETAHAAVAAVARTATAAVASVPIAATPVVHVSATPFEAPPERTHVTEGVLMTIGGAALATGAVFGVLAVRADRHFDATSVRTEQLELRDAARSNARIADAFLAGGAISGGIGLLLWALDVNTF